MLMELMLACIVLVCYCFRFVLVSEVVVSAFDNPLPTGFNVSAHVLSLGYPFEVHQNVRTEDGYLLDIHRIPHGRNSSARSKGVVFIMHGLGASCECWLIGDPKKMLAFMLADGGYDVWVGNARGTSHSKKHVKLKPTEAKFWDFSWHEIGYYDLPANLNYILNYTKQSELFYVGHSQGGTVFFVMASMRPEMNRMVKLMIGLAPGAFYGIESLFLPDLPASLLAQFLNNFKDTIGFHFFDYNLYAVYCKVFQAVINVKNLCDISSLIIAGLNTLHTDKEVFSMLRDIIPDSLAVKQLLHYLQLILTAKFKQYDYGPRQNKQIYGRARPPLYDLKKVTAPVGVFYGNSDVQVTVPNSQKLIRTLPNVHIHQLISEPLFTHLDMLMHFNVDKILNNNLLKIMANYTATQN